MKLEKLKFRQLSKTLNDVGMQRFAIETKVLSKIYKNKRGDGPWKEW